MHYIFVALLHETIHKPEANLKAQELGTLIPQCRSAFQPYSEHQNGMWCTPGQHEFLPFSALCPYHGFHGKKTYVCRQDEGGGLPRKFLAVIRDQNKEPILL